MEKRKYLKLISDIEVEGCLKLPVSDLEEFDNTFILKQIKFQSFKAKSELNRKKNEICLNDSFNLVKSKIDKLFTLSIEQLQEMLLKRSPSMQFRNLDKLDKEEIIKILGDYMQLDNLENEEE